MKDMKCMKKRKENIMRIRVLILVLGLAIVSGLVYRACSSKVADAGWGEGEVKTSEQYYYESRFKDIITRRRNRAWKTKNSVPGFFLVPYNEYLHVDLDKGAIWIEIDGKVHPDDYMELPGNMKWKLSLRTEEAVKDLGQKVTLKIRGVRTNRILPEVIYFVGTGRGNGHVKFTIGSAVGDSHFTDSAVPVIKPSGEQQYPPRNKLYGSLIVSDEEYAEYAKQFGGKTDEIKFDGSDEAINWFSVRKKVFQRIDVEIAKHEYQLDEIEYLKADDHSAVLASVEGWPERSRFDFLLSFLRRKDGGRAKFLVKADYLGEGVWYSRSYPDLQNWHRNQLAMEFITHDKSSMSKKEYKKWLARGRDKQNVAVDPKTKWKAKFADGTVFELLEIRQGSCIGGDWWGPDGSSIDNEVLIFDNHNRDSKSSYNFIFKISWAANTTKSRIDASFVDFNGGGHSRSGLHPGFTIKSFNYLMKKPVKKTSLTLKVSTNGGKAETVTFKNVSLEAGVDYGFEILKGVEGDKTSLVLE